MIPCVFVEAGGDGSIMFTDLMPDEPCVGSIITLMLLPPGKKSTKGLTSTWRVRRVQRVQRAALVHLEAYEPAP